MNSPGLAPSKESSVGWSGERGKETSGETKRTPSLIWLRSTPTVIKCVDSMFSLMRCDENGTLCLQSFSPDPKPQSDHKKSTWQLQHSIKYLTNTPQNSHGHLKPRKGSQEEPKGASQLNVINRGLSGNRKGTLCKNLKYENLNKI